ncbi:MAG: ATP-binding protein [Candidatus Viridilinea halotolerans]|uniref:ATP-binding protein n=1 Tax=Candidatus Viridilinea halotolerans TaxID=2491704 RepID=A0A426TRA6_9CHLR|nr:MAG: ATP-binding protein [Candidatus Viridilinea halotolerans]
MRSQPATYGHWEQLDGMPSLGRYTMDLDARHLTQYWRRCSLSSNFWSRYMALWIPTPPAPGHLRRDAMEHILSYLLNELFENCAKFSGGPFQRIAYAAWVHEERMVFELTNHVQPAAQAPFAALIEEMLTGDLDELYFQRLEASAESNAPGSGLGYLTLMKDYGIRFGFRFSAITNASIAVGVQAHVALKEW